MTMNSKHAALCYPNIDTKATLSGGAWTMGLPLNNLKTRRIKQTARSTNLLPASTQFVATFDKSRPMRAVSLANHNLTIDATYRMRFYDDVGLTELVADSTELPVFSAVYDEETDPGGWDGGNLWDLTLTEEDRQGLNAYLTYLLPDSISAQYVLVELFDEVNPAGYVEAGRLFVGDAWTPTHNMSYGASLQYEPRSKTRESDSGGEYHAVRPAPRVARFALGFMSEEEGMARALDMQRTLGTTEDVLFIWNQSDTLHAQRRTYLGRFRELNPIEQDFFNNFRTTHECKEQI